MKTNSRTISSIIITLALFLYQVTNAQSVLDPSDPIVIYNSSAPPTQPAWGQIGKWVKTNRLSWNTSSFKAYIYKGFAFRLKFPKTYDHTANDGKKYPMMIFFHGLGERGTIYDNEFSLLHGGQQFRDKVDNGTYDGFVFVMQTQNGYWGTPAYDVIKEIIDYMVINNKLDPFRVVDNGLSAGGAGTWEMLIENPTYIAGALPMSSCCICYNNATTINKIKYTPIWIFQGGLDPSPDPYTTEVVRDAILNAGGNFKYTLYPNLAHGTWNTVWTEPDFYPFALRAYSSNPWTLYGRTEFCPGDPINVTIGLAAGFNQYEWRKDGVLIPGATTNTIQVSGASAIGVYSARVRRGTFWSDWSRTPVEIKIKAPTVPPTISIAGLMSKVIPALDGNNGVTLQVPTGYTSYLWQKEGSSATIGTTNTLNATTPGSYKVRVTEQFGCSTDFSTLFAVVDANGPNKPDPAINLIITTLSKTSLRLDWSDNPAPQYNETNFEVYRASQAGGPYTLLAILNADVLTYTSTGLNANTKYFYKVRAVNNTGAAAASNEANGTTAADTQAPTAPTNLAIAGTTRSSISLSWTAATDDVGVTKYDVYVNGVKAYVTTQTQFTVYNLQFSQTYNFSVKARDFAENVSPFSNQVTGQALLMGLPYKYYTFTGTWNNLPNFTTLTPVSTGVMPNIALTPRTQNDNFAFLWEGNINIPVTGTYYFRTNSDDGSRLWLGPLNGSTSPYSFSGTPIVNNDGLHGTQDRTSVALSLTAGVYPIAIAFYEQGGGESMTVRWRTPLSGTNFDLIPNSAFADAPIVLGGPPAAPSGLLATAVSFNQINLSWADNSTDETGFEIWRSTSINSGFSTVGLAPANATSYSDLNLSPNTTYYYQIRAIGQYGESQLVGNVNVVQANWKFNNNYTDASGNNRTLNANNTPTFSTDRQEGTHSVDLNGTDEDLTVNTGTGDYLRGGYNRKTVAFWLRADNTSNNSGVFDFGGTDDGLSMRLNANVLHAGIASNNTRRSITIPYTSTGWNHIALVYNSSELALYVNGVQVAANNALPFTSVGTTTDGSMIGDDNGGNALNTGFGQLNGRIDNFYIVDKALSVEELTKLMNDLELGQNYATTLPLPAVPEIPGNLLASGISSSKINISWTDVANETSYELYRSSNTNANYLLFATLPANTTSFIDSGLFANSIHYYKLRAVNVGGPSGYSNEDSAITINNLPVIATIADQYMRYGSQLNLNISASDIDPGTLTLQVNNLPSFASFTPGSNGTGVISFTNPAIGDQGTYNNIEVTVADQQGGNSSLSFSLVVNDNYVPVISAISNISVNELQTTQVNLTAVDQNVGENLTWTLTGLPSFATPVINGGSVQINFAPGYADNGPYWVMARVQDENNGFDTASFMITVNDVNPNKKVYINFTDGTYTAGSPWNNTNKPTPSLNDVFGNLNDETGVNTGIGIRITSPWQNLGNATNTYGVNTGNNSGVYPDNVMRSAYFTDASTQTMTVQGLNPAYKYNFTFFGSRSGVNDNRNTIYTIGGSSVTLNAASNSQNTVSVNNVQPNPDGTLPMTLQRAAGASYGYLNAMVIQILYDDGTAPAKPRNLTGQFASGAIKLNWIDAAYNEAAYEVYRSSTNQPGSFTLLNPGGNNANLQQYDDLNFLGNTTYYYYVIATNSQGSSPSSDTVSVTTPNASPLINAIADVKMKTQQIIDVNIVALDDPSDVITLQVTGLPSFATFTGTGNGTGTINIAPGNTMGTFTGITVTATDNKGAASNRQFSIIVSNKDITSYYVNFNQVLPVGTPWNNFNSAPIAGTAISNIQDDGGNSSGINISLIDGWDGANDVGATATNNSGIFPNDVMKTAYFTSATTAKRIRITGLATGTTKYNLVLFASRGGVNDVRNTTYSYSGQSVTLNAANNSSNVVQIQGVVPDINGVIEFTAQKATGSAFGYINALIIQSYIDNGIPLAPANLTAVPKSTTSIQLNWSDLSNNEDGFEVYKSVTYDGPYSLLTTTSANVTSFLDVGLVPGTLYYYKVRAKKIPVFYSAYSNIAGASTLLYSVYVNFNQENPAGSPWNNTNEAPIENDVYANLKNNMNNPTGINLTVIGNAFNGVNPLGMNTGNNSGVYPDNVIRSTWWLDANSIARLKIDGLSLANAYNFTFFASRDGGGSTPDRTCVYSIGNKTVSLNAANNINNTVQISNIIPDEDGSVMIEIKAGGASPFAYIGALVIDSYVAGIISESNGSSSLITIMQKGTENVPVVPNSNLKPGESTLKLTKMNVQKPVSSSLDNIITAYPNPFISDFVLKISLEEEVDKVQLMVLDATGKVVHTRELKKLLRGENMFRIELGNGILAEGLYFVQIIGLSRERPRTIKLLKVK